MAAETVFIVDDEAAVRDSIALLLKSVGLQCQCFADAQQFLAACEPEQPGCLVLDVRMPHMSGIELQAELNRRGIPLPVIFITGHGDVPMAVEAMRAGAMEFLQKPFKDDELIRRVQRALAEDRKLRTQNSARAEILGRYESLTPRERQVAQAVVAGDANKVVAANLQLSERTVEVHRARIMQKMKARSLAQLVHMVRDLDAPGTT